MKKIFFTLFFVLSTYSFSCSYVTEPNIYIRKIIESIKELNYESKIYCDEDEVKMIYYYGNDYEDIEIGLVKHTENFDNLSEDEAIEFTLSLVKDSSKIMKLYSQKMKTIKNTSQNFSELPENINFRIYIESEDEVMMTLKTVLSLNDGESAFFFNKDLEEVINNKGLKNYYFTDDIIY